MPQSMTLPQHMRALSVLGLPLIGSQLAQFLIGLTDTIMIGRYGVAELAALVVATSVFFVFVVVGSGFAWAVMPVVAEASEAQDATRVRRVTRMGWWASIGFAAVVTPPVLLARPLFDWLGQTPDVAVLARDYLDITFLGLIPALTIMLFRSYLSALERTQIVLWVTVATVLVNAGVNYLLIFGNFGFPEMGVRGAAIASVISMIGGAIALAVYAVRNFPEHALFQRIWRPDGPVLAQVFRLGWPIGVTNLAEVGLFAASSIMVGWVGTIELAAHGIALQCASATFMIHIGLSQAATVRAGRALGRHDMEHLRRGAKAGILLSMCYSVFAVALFLILPEELMRIFVDPATPETQVLTGVGVTLLAMAAVFQFADGLQVMALSLLRGLQDTRRPMILAAVGYWVIGAPTAYVLGFPMGLGAVGIWGGLSLGLICTAILLLHWFWRRALPRMELNQKAFLSPA